MNRMCPWTKMLVAIIAIAFIMLILSPSKSSQQPTMMLSPAQQVALRQIQRQEKELQGDIQHYKSSKECFSACSM
jgi:hypothetical protein